MTNSSRMNKDLVRHEFYTTMNFIYYDFLHFVIVSLIIAVFSAVMNVLSLSFFVKKRKENDVRQFLLLNLYDLFVSIMAFLQITFTFKSLKMLIEYSRPYDDKEAHRKVIEVLILYRSLSEYSGLVYKSAILATGLVTTVLSIHRLILVKDPFKLLNMKAPIIALTVIPILLIPAFVLPHKYGIHDIVDVKDWYTSGSLCVLILISLICNAITITLLYRTSQTDNAIRAAVTVFIISAVFTVLNTCYVVTDTLQFQYYRHNYEEIVSVRPLWSGKYLKEAYICLGLSLISQPLNSFLNPVIHFIRSSRMRAHLKNLFKRNKASSSNPDGRKTPRIAKPKDLSKN